MVGLNAEIDISSRVRCMKFPHGLARFFPIYISYSLVKNSCTSGRIGVYSDRTYWRVIVKVRVCCVSRWLVCGDYSPLLPAPLLSIFLVSLHHVLVGRDDWGESTVAGRPAGGVTSWRHIDCRNTVITLLFVSRVFYGCCLGDVSGWPTWKCFPHLC